MRGKQAIIESDGGKKLKMAMDQDRGSADTWEKAHGLVEGVQYH